MPLAQLAGSSEAAADAVARRPGAAFVAGGTNLLDPMKLEIDTLAHLVDVNRAGLDRREGTGDGGLRIGALLRNSDLAADPRMRRRWPVLPRALLAGASGQLRDRATTAGDLPQCVRCPYFYVPAQACTKRRPGSGCTAPDGPMRLHAVLGASDRCIAAHRCDMAVAICACSTRAWRPCAGGSRRVAAVAPPALAPPGRQVYRKVMSAANCGNHLSRSRCRVALRPEGTLEVCMSMTDIGTGSRIVLSRTAAEMLGLPLERVGMRLADSDLLEPSGSGGSFGAASAGSALYEACAMLRAAGGGLPVTIDKVLAELP